MNGRRQLHSLLQELESQQQFCPTCGHSRARIVTSSNIAPAAWGKELPGWVAALAGEVERTTKLRAAKLVGITPAMITGVLANKYLGDLNAVEGKTRQGLNLSSLTGSRP